MTRFKTDISKQGKQFELVFTTDNKDYFKKVQSVAEECIDHKPITQFDRIKAMSVEQLAQLLNSCDFNYPPYCNDPDGSETFCLDCAKKWLESEVQGE